MTGNGNGRRALGAYFRGRKLPPEMFGPPRRRHLHKNVLLAIAGHADPDGTNAYPSQETLAAEAATSARNIRRAVTWLQEQEMVKILWKGTATSRQGRTNTYEIPLDSLVARAEALRADQTPGQDTHVLDNGDQDMASANTRTGEQEHRDWADAPLDRQPDATSERPGQDVLEPSLPSLPTKETERKTDNITSTLENSAATGKPNAAAVADAAGSPPTPSRSASTGKPIDALDLMAGVAEVGRLNGVGIPTTPKHRMEALTVANRYGLQVMLAGLDNWLSADTTLQELAIGSRDQNGNYPIKTWLLHEFCRSGSGLRALNQAKVYGERPWKLISFLLQREVPPSNLTAKHYAALQWIYESEHLEDFDRSFSGRTGEEKDVAKALAYAKERCAEVHEQDRQSQRKAHKDAQQPLLEIPLFDEKPWEGYAPFAERLRALEPEPIPA